MVIGEKTLSDIEEIPKAIDSVINYKNELSDIAKEILEHDPKRIVFIGCGSSFYSGLLIQAPLVKIINEFYSMSMPSSEALIYYSKMFDNKTAVLGISRSGETAETLAALGKAREKGALTILLSITEKNNGKSVVDRYVYIDVGNERSIIMTKSFVTLSLAGLLITSEIYRFFTKKEYIGMENLLHLLEYVKKLMLAERDKLINLGKKYAEKKIERYVFLGSGPSYAIALEGSLKLKETSYIASEALHALEFRHGPIATIGENQVEIVINPIGESYDFVYRLYNDILTYGGKVLRLSDANKSDIELPYTGVEELTALAAIIPLQLFAFGFAVGKGRDPDKPRNLVRYVNRF